MTDLRRLFLARTLLRGDPNPLISNAEEASWMFNAEAISVVTG
jgi:hypothetical protein